MRKIGLGVLVGILLFTCRGPMSYRFREVKAQTRSQVYEQIYRLVAYCENRPKIRRQTGFLVTTEEGSGIVTALHGIADCGPVSTERDPSISVQRMFTDLEIKMIDIDHDIALLSSDELETLLDEGATDQSLSPLRPGSEKDEDGVLHVMGYPIEMEEQNRTRAPVVDKDRRLEGLLESKQRSDLRNRGSPDPTVTVWQVQAPLLPGHSGAPLLTTDGQVLGVVNGGLRKGTIDIAWVMPWNRINLVSINSDEASRDLSNLRKQDPLLDFSFSSTFPPLSMLEVDSRVEVSEGKSRYLVKGTGVNQYWPGDELVVYKEVPGAKRPIGLLSVIQANHEEGELLTEEMLIHPDDEIVREMIVDEDVDNLHFMGDLVPSDPVVDGFILRRGTIRLAEGRQIEKGNVMVALELESEGGRVLDYYRTDVEFEVSRLGVLGRTANVRLVTGSWPKPGTLVIRTEKCMSTYLVLDDNDNSAVQYAEVRLGEFTTLADDEGNVEAPLPCNSVTEVSIVIQATGYKVFRGVVPAIADGFQIRLAPISLKVTPRPQTTMTPRPQPTVTPRPQPTVTPRPQPTVTPRPQPTVTPRPQPTVTPRPQPTVTPRPQPTVTPQPKLQKIHVSDVVLKSPLLKVLDGVHVFEWETDYEPTGDRLFEVVIWPEEGNALDHGRGLRATSNSRIDVNVVGTISDMIDKGKHCWPELDNVCIRDGDKYNWGILIIDSGENGYKRIGYLDGNHLFTLDLPDGSQDTPSIGSDLPFKP